MFQRSLEAIVKKRIKQYRTEKIILFILIALGAVLIVAGGGVYFYVGKLTLVKKVYAVPALDFTIIELHELRLLCDFARMLGIVFLLVGLASVILAWDRLTFSTESYRMALFISERKKEQISGK
ncbi:hypothetical protein H5U35_00060 [Candidatus Aerophobetes bacterium]|nr:hypothetical protein [Candidatus Aerophobetes bacterium]